MRKHKNVTIFALLLVLLMLALLALSFLSSASAVTVSFVNSPEFEPGEEGEIEIIIENTFSEEVRDVDFTLDFMNLPFIPLGSSSAGFDEIEDGDDAMAFFKIKSVNDATPGSYQIPYTINFVQGGTEKTRTGSIGLVISAQPILSYSVELEKPVAGEKGRINLKIVNKGLANAKFVSVKAASGGYTVLSENEVYIGAVDSDDFEIASFDVIFNSEKASFYAIVTYADFDNVKMTESLEIPMTIYTKDKAIELGIIEGSNTGFYVGIIVALIVLWIVWRSVRKRRRLKRSERERIRGG